MAKAYYEYSESGAVYAFLQDDTIGAGMGNTPASPTTPRLPQRLRPRKVSIRYGSSPYTYKHYVVGLPAQLDALTFGSTVGGGIVVGKDYGYSNAQAAY